MPRNRSSAIVIKDDKVLVMHRINKSDEYWVFPGGGVESSETPEHAAVRETDEETTVKVTIQKLLYRITWDSGEVHFFYLCDYQSGEPCLREDSEEFAKSKSGEQVYEPIWVPVADLANLQLYQLEVRDMFISDYAHGFSNETKELFIKVAERRQK